VDAVSKVIDGVGVAVIVVGLPQTVVRAFQAASATGATRSIVLVWPSSC
jgi:hypothetical protein